MGGTKIVVFQLKEIIKSVIILCAALAAIAFLIFLFSPGEKLSEPKPSALYDPGTYYSEIVLHNSPVRVAVTVDEMEIVSISMEEMEETQEVFYPLFAPAMDTLSKEIITAQSLDVQTSRDSAVTEEILIKAIRAALEKAEADSRA